MKGDKSTGKTTRQTCQMEESAYLEHEGLEDKATDSFLLYWLHDALVVCLKKKQNKLYDVIKDVFVVHRCVR